MPFDFYPFIRVHRKAPPKPRLLIKVIEPKSRNEAKGFAFIDSGSNRCLLPFSFAKQLKIKRREGTKVKVYDIAGKRRKGFSYSLLVEIFGVLLDSSPDNLLFTDDTILRLPETSVVFIKNLKEPILGVIGFLDKYVYTVNHGRMRYSVRTPIVERECEICRPR